MWTKKDSPPGPPLGRSPADVLSEAGVFYAVAINTDGGKSSFLSLLRADLDGILTLALQRTPRRLPHPVAGAGGLVDRQVRGAVRPRGAAARVEQRGGDPRPGEER